MDSMKLADELREVILANVRQAQRDSRLDGILTERAQWEIAIKAACQDGQTYRRILLHRYIVAS